MIDDLVMSVKGEGVPGKVVTVTVFDNDLYRCDLYRWR